MGHKIEQADVADLKNGFLYDEDSKIFSCLFCNAKFEDGDIYTVENRSVDARKAMRLHISEHHRGVFDALITVGKKQTGLTDTQKNILLSFYNGKTDGQIAQETGTAPSTVRYQRYNFREKAKQAKMIIALSELLESKLSEKESVPDENSGDDSKMDIFFESVMPLVLKTFEVRTKNQKFILKIIAQQFEPGKIYSEKQVNEVLQPIYSDYVLIRRALIDYAFLKRLPDGDEYWLA